MIFTLSKFIIPMTIALFVVLFAIIFVLIFQNQKKSLELRRQTNVVNQPFFEGLSAKSSDIYVLIRKEDLLPVYISENITSILGFDLEELQHDIQLLRKIMKREDYWVFKEKFQEWDGQDTFELEFSYKSLKDEEDAEYRWGIVTIDTSGDGTAYVLVFRDITKLRDERVELQEALEEAVAASQSKTDFLSTMSHEIRTPMNGVLGMIELAKMNVGDQEAMENYLEKAQNLSGFLITLINDILDMSRIESNRLQLEHAKFDLFACAEKIEDMYRQVIEEKGITFKIEMEDLDVRYVVGDELRISQVVINFLSNAMKFTPEEGQITLTFKQMHKIEDKVHLLIRVRDTGKGIEPEFLKRIFNPFEQESASIAKNYGGSGLGMAISDNLIRLMDGQIVIDSEVGRGSDFNIYVAFEIAEGDQTLPVKGERITKKESDQKAISYEGCKILMAEDNEINEMIAVTIFNRKGASVDVAHNGLEAVQMFKDSVPGQYDVILMDVQMPEMDGWEATTKIREMSREDAGTIPIFALSADAFLEDQKHSLEVGMNGHLTKPIDYDLLARTLAQCL